MGCRFGLNYIIGSNQDPTAYIAPLLRKERCGAYFSVYMCYAVLQLSGYRA